MNFEVRADVLNLFDNINFDTGRPDATARFGAPASSRRPGSTMIRATPTIQVAASVS